MADVPTVSFRPLTRDDLPMLHEWLGRPHVAEWWPDRPSPEGMPDEFPSCVVPDAPVRSHVVLLDATPVGYIQSYVVLGAGGGWWPDERDPGARGIDQFLADPALLSRGIGTAMVRAFVATLFADPAVTRVQTDPDPTNARAIRCYEKAGFQRVGEIVTPDGRALLMQWPRPATSAA